MCNLSINSNFIELVDIFHLTRGKLFLAIIPLFISIGFPLGMSFSITSGWTQLIEDEKIASSIFFLIVTIIFAIPMAWVSWYTFRADAFAYTHYPIRLCRKNRMVYVFRFDGTVLSAPWDEIYFTCIQSKGWGDWKLIGFVLEEDRKTIKESIFFINPSEEKEHMLAIWEYMRSYMEDGPEEAYRVTHYCLPLGDRREPAWFGFLTLIMNFNGYPLMMIAMAPLALVFAVSRYLAGLTCKIPVWPKEVQEACAIEPGDPYQRDWHDNPPFSQMNSTLVSHFALSFFVFIDIIIFVY